MSGMDQSPDLVHLRLLGGFDLQSGQGMMAIPAGRKVRALLACLALSSGRAWPREKLMALLWSSRSDEQARASLRQALAEMRRVLGQPSAVRAEHDTVSIDPALVAVDAVEFEQLARADKWEEAAALYRGPLLDGHGVRDGAFEDWIRVERTRLHDLAVGVHEQLASSRSGEAAIKAAQQLLALDPAREETHRLLMRLYAAAGQRSQALRQYDHCRDVLQRDLQARPDAETEALHRRVQSETVLAAAATMSAAKADSARQPENRPSIAVLPFTNMSGDPEQEYFSEGFTEDIITELGRFRSLLVIARFSSFPFKGQSVDVKEVGRQLGARYVVEGSVRRAGNRIRITAQLLESASGNRLWAERYDRNVDDISDAQDEIMRMIVASLPAHVEEAEQTSVLKRTKEDSSAYDHRLRGKHLLSVGPSREEVLRARQHFEKAIELDPGCAAAAYCDMADSYYAEYLSSWTTSREAAADQIFKLSHRAVELDPRDSRTHFWLAWGYLHAKGDLELSRIQIDEALALNPNDYHNYCSSGWVAVCSGDLDHALACSNEARQRSPLVSDSCLETRIAVEYLAGNYPESIKAFGRMLRPNGPVHGWIAATYAQLGRAEEARAMARQFLDDIQDLPWRPKGDDPIEWGRYWDVEFPAKDATARKHLFDGLRKAGLPV